MSQWGVFYPLLHKSISNPVILSVAFPFIESLAGVNATARNGFQRQSNPLINNIKRICHSETGIVAQPAKNLIHSTHASACHPEPCLQSLRRRISHVQTKGGYQYAN